MDLWWDDDSRSVTVDVLLPNSILLQISTAKDATLSDLKEAVWEEAKRLPFYRRLKHDKDAYVFLCVNAKTSHREELFDDSRQLSDVKPFCGLLKLVEVQGDRAMTVLNAEIGILMNKSLSDFDALENPEVHDFRWRMRLFAEDVARRRRNLPPHQQLFYHFSPSLESSATLPGYLKGKLYGGDRILVEVRCDRCVSSKFLVQFSATVGSFLEQVLEKFSNALGEAKPPGNFTLKIKGKEEYLLGDYPLSQYKYVRECIANDVTPKLSLAPIDDLISQINDAYSAIANLVRKAKATFGTIQENKKTTTKISSWKVKKNFSLTVNYAKKINCNENANVVVSTGLFLGGEPLCPAQVTLAKEVSEGGCYWETAITFDLKVCDIPKLTRVCFALFEIDKTISRNSSQVRTSYDLVQNGCLTPLAWANTTVYDYREILKSGIATLNMWPYCQDAPIESILNPLGTVLSNPNPCQATSLTITFHKYHRNEIGFPTFEQMKETSVHCGNVDLPRVNKNILEELREISEREPLQPLYEQEKQLLWLLRNYCRQHFPEILPKLLKSLKWQDHRDVAQMMSLLETWPKLPFARALELLDYAYADSTVRDFAVGCLQDVSDEELSLYLLQLVQAIKHEAFFCSTLVEFLLTRALSSRVIGHKFFWLLRSEMNDPSSSVRYGLILEAYCRGALEHVKILSKQVDAINKLKQASDHIKNECSRKRLSREKFAAEILGQKCFQAYFKDFHSPLHPSHKLSCLKSEKCRFLDSKMKPIWLVFANADLNEEDVYMIFKVGDDLRQDMLTLQMIRIMDKLWKEAGYDFRMVPYHCLPTDNKAGLIEVVLNAATIANIQKGKASTATSAFVKGSLLSWLRDHHDDDAEFDKCIREFTLSCAGYCVATYVLGIADRHSDNIMVKTNGQLFHIDFGHILGKFKEKFGVRRERVPFVLTHDFVHVITKGLSASKSHEFSRFRAYCEDAFMILRRNGSLIISLFAMMVSTGMPELTSEKDLDYLLEALVLDLPETKALEHFRCKFNEALNNSWKTSANWWMHNLVKDSG